MTGPGQLCAWAMVLGLAALMSGCGIGTAPKATSGLSHSSPASSRTSGLPAGTSLHLTRIAMFSGRIGWASSRTHLLTTQDGVRLWTAVNPSHVSGNFTGKNVAAAFITPQDAVIAAQNTSGSPVKLFRTRDQGRRWTMSILHLSTHMAATFQGGSVSLDFVSPKEGWLLLASQGFAGSQMDALFRTTDGGQQWHELQHTPAPASAAAKVPFEDVTHVTMNSEGWGLASVNTEVFGRATILVTANGGRSWVPESLPLPSTAAQSQVFEGCVEVASLHSAWVVVSFGLASTHPPQQDLVFYHTTDRSQHWTAMPWASSLPLGSSGYAQKQWSEGTAQSWLAPQHQVFFLPNTQGMAVLRWGKMKKGDKTWHPIAQIPMPRMTAQSWVGNHGWIVGGTGDYPRGNAGSTWDYQTDNGGSTWTRFSPSLVSGSNTH